MKILLPLSTVILAPLASGQVLWTETIDGELSSSTAGMATDIGSLILGSNEVIGSIAIANDAGQDIFSFEVPTGLTLDAVVLTRLNLLTGSTGGQGAFFAAEEGASLTSTSDDAALLGSGFINSSNLNSNVLQVATGSSNPLAASRYTFWFRENSGTLDYTFDFQTSAIPEPSTLTLCALPLLGCFRRRRKN